MKLSKITLTPIYAISAVFALAVLAAGSAFGATAGRFAGTGRYLDPDNWSGKTLPKNNDNADGFLSGHAVATNETETLEGSKWMHIGGTFGTDMGVLDIVNSNYKATILRLGAGWDKRSRDTQGIYHQQGGTFTATSSLELGWANPGWDSANHRLALATFEDVNLTVSALLVGVAPSFDGLKTDDRLVVSGGSLTVSQLGIGVASNGGGKYQGSVLLTNTVVVTKTTNWPIISGTAEDSAELEVIDSTWENKGECFTIAGAANSFGKAVFVDCPSVDFYKPRLGNGANAQGGLYMTNCVVRNTWEAFIGNANGAKGTVDLYDSCWTNNSGAIRVGSAAGGSGYFAIHGANSVYNDSGKGVSLGVGAGAYGEMLFDGLPWANIACTVFPGASTGAKGRVIFKDIPETIGFLRKTTQVEGGDGTVEYRNCQVASSETTFGTRVNTGLSVVLNDSRLDWNFSGDNLWFLDQNGMWSGFYVTNSTMVIDGVTKSVQHTKTNARLEFTSKDSFVAIATNATFSSATSASGVGVFTFEGDRNKVVLGKFGLSLGTNTVNFLGGEVAVSEISLNKSGAQNLNFNGATLKARASKTSGDGWVGNGDHMDARVLEGGAKFDTDGFNCWFWPVLKHGGAAAKDGGIVKAGAGTLAVKPLPTMTGDIVVEEGTLDLSNESDYVMAAGQAIGGAGTLKVGSGFVAGGLRCDAAQANGLTVDGALAFAEGSSLVMTGFDEDSARVTLVTATSITGADRITNVTGLPDTWHLVIRPNSIRACKKMGLSVIIR